MGDRRFCTISALAILGLSSAGASAQELTLYCSPQIEWCQVMVEAFEKETGISVAMTRKSSGETYAQIAAEAREPLETQLALVRTRRAALEELEDELVAKRRRMREILKELDEGPAA